MNMLKMPTATSPGREARQASRTASLLTADLRNFSFAI
jgi:hypothetical protein